MGKRKTTSQFIAEAKAVHGDKYDYSNVEYKNDRTKVCIVCLTHGEFWQSPSNHLQGQGCPLCGYAKRHVLKFGVAEFDEPRTSSSEPYNAWQRMLRRCYHPQTHEVTYSDCQVCDAWLTFSNFKEWFEDPTNGHQEGYHLDKDILVKGNKKYSPTTCCFVPQELNKLLTNRRNHRGNSPIGVHKEGDRYRSCFRKFGKAKTLGRFNTPEEAFQVYKAAKEQHIRELAEKYFQEGKITKKVYDALMKYEVEITD